MKISLAVPTLAVHYFVKSVLPQNPRVLALSNQRIRQPYWIDSRFILGNVFFAMPAGIPTRVPITQDEHVIYILNIQYIIYYYIILFNCFYEIY